MTSLVLALPGNEEAAVEISRRTGSESGRVAVRRFPDGETSFRLLSDPRDRPVVLVCTLDRPDEKMLPLLFAAATARDLGARSVGLVAPYLAYLRQDRRFQPGEAVTSALFAQLLSGAMDWLVTVDPHLHRYHGLEEIYSIPAWVVHAAPLLSSWIKANVREPVVLGPDAESAQWAEEVARGAGAPVAILEKTRRGDRDVEVSVPDSGPWRERTPVLVDDIISTGRTMIAAVRALRLAGCPPPVCLGVHAVFAPGAHEELLESGASRVVTANTIRHPSNDVSVDGLLAQEVTSLEVDS